jgi:hypothetical protein
MNNIEANSLFDVYGSLLTGRQQEILTLYIQEDYSYGEISQELGISRAAVMDAVHRGMDLLLRYEREVGYVKARNQVFEAVADHPELTDRMKKIFS